MRKGKLYRKSPIICEPSDSMSRLSYIVGWVSRALVHFACVAGSCLFIADSFGITSGFVKENNASVGLIVLVCFIVSVLTSVAAFNKKALLITPIASAAAFLGILAIWGNPITFAWDAIRCVWNTGIHRLAESGYVSFSTYILSPDSYGHSIAQCLNAGMVIVAALFGVIFGLCLIRRAKMLPTAIVCIVLLVPVFTYNLTRTNIGMTCAVIFIISALAICLYDRRYSGKEFDFIRRREKREAKKAAKKQAKLDKKKKKQILKKRAKAAYESALALSDDRSAAKAAKKAVYDLEKQKKKDAAKAIRDEKAEAKKAVKKAKKAAREQAKKDKAAQKKLDKSNAARAKKDKDFAKALAEEKKASAKAKTAAKKEAKAQKRAAQHEVNEHKRYNIAAGGFAGLIAVSLALLAVLLPAISVSGNFPIIPAINKPISVARAYITAYLSGDDIDLNDLDVYGELSGMIPRTLSFDPLTYEQTQIFAAYTDSVKPFYLKSWMATDFDYATNTWVGASNEDVIAYRDRFYKNFTPDQLRTAFFQYVFPTSVMMHNKNAFMSFDKYGFFVENINLRRVNSASKIIFVPPVMNTNYAISAFGTNTPVEAKYSRFFDGIYSSRFFDRDLTYSVAAFAANYKDAKVADGIDDSQRYFTVAMKYADYVDQCREVLRMRTVEDDKIEDITIDDKTRFSVSKNDFSDLLAKFEAELEAENISHVGDSLVQTYIKMTDEEREALREYIELDKDYDKYAAETYSARFGNEKIEELAKSILAEKGYTAKYNRLGDFLGYVDADGESVPTHSVIMSAINYLRENYTYTITPTAPETETADVLSAFLFDTKEGYCTHFATAAAALIREFGYPVRFCEGYIAHDFIRDYSENATAKYMTYVIDEDAHAWIEVYVDGYGWMDYETTPEYAAPMYDPDYVEPEDPEEPDEPEKDPEDKPKPEEPEEEPVIPEEPEIITEEEREANFTRIATRVGIGAAIVVAVIAIFRVIWMILKSRAKKETDRRYEPVRDALDDVRKHKTAEDNGTLGIELNDQIMNVLHIAGLDPEDGEGVAEYAERLEGYFGGLTEAPIREVLTYMMQAEFGGRLEQSELWTMADFLARLVPSAYDGLSPAKKIWWRYIKRKI